MSGSGLDASQEVVLIAQYVIVVCCVQTCKFQTCLEDVITIILFHGSLQMFYLYISHASILYYSGSIQLTPAVDTHG